MYFQPIVLVVVVLRVVRCKMLSVVRQGIVVQMVQVVLAWIMAQAMQMIMEPTRLGSDLGLPKLPEKNETYMKPQVMRPIGRGAPTVWLDEADARPMLMWIMRAKPSQF